MDTAESLQRAKLIQWTGNDMNGSKPKSTEVNTSVVREKPITFVEESRARLNIAKHH